MKAKLQEAIKKIESHVPAAWKATAVLQGYGLWKIPLLFSVRPKVKEINDRRVVVEVPLTRWTKNHLGSMYFGALAIGADCTVGLLALHHVDKLKGEVHLSFKDFQADFLKRPEGNVLFICEAGEELSRFASQVMRSGERRNLPVKAHCVVKGKEDEVVARFTLTLSLKRKG